MLTLPPKEPEPPIKDNTPPDASGDVDDDDPDEIVVDAPVTDIPTPGDISTEPAELVPLVPLRMLTDPDALADELPL